MRRRVLILTPSFGFGGLIRQVLEDTGDYEPFQFATFLEAKELADKAAVALIILDAELGKEISVQRTEELRSHAPHAKLILIPNEDDPHDPGLKDYKADATLPSPFYLPDLVAAIEQFFGPLVPKQQAKRYGDSAPHMNQPIKQQAEAPAWLEDVSQSARYLTQLSLESASQAALITREGNVWAYAGELPKQAADELADAVAEHAASGNEADLARFIHLHATDSDYMLYATSLGGEYTLALVFDAQMPFSQMRAQVSELAKAIATAPLDLAKAEARNVAQAQRPATARLEQGGETPQEPEPPRRNEERSAPQVPAMSGNTGRLEPLTAGSSDLHYAFVLIPRLPKHRLEGDLADLLAQWLPELCLAFAWRLESMNIQPEFLQWMISMAPEASPESAVRTLDKHLSQRIFEEFPRAAKENPSGQFWAPGFLIVTGSLPTGPQVSEHIQQTRARQGVPR